MHIGSLPLASRYLLAPLAGYTNLAFRLSVRALGGLGLATTDLVNARALLQASRKTMELIQTCPEDRPVAVQIYGTNPAEMRDAARWLEDYGVSSVDINMGCPVNKVTRGGGGSAMMCDAVNTVGLVRTVVEGVRIPVTVKMRLGWDDDNLSAPFFAREFERAGVAAVTIHGRTRAQGFGGRVNLDGIRAVVEAVERIPILGNGDVRTIADAVAMRRLTGCAGVAIGRGALLNPWIFAQLSRYEATGDAGPPGTYRQRLEFMDRHFHLLVEHRGEHFACLTFRKVANWYCRVLRPGRDIQQRLVMIDSVRTFEEIVAEIGELLAGRSGQDWPDAELPLRVPGGPVERWQGVAHMTPLPETILQFGAGRFLRAFADLFIHHANEAGQNVGRIVIVQSTGDDRAAALNRQNGRYHVAVRGYEGGAVVDRVEMSASVSRAVVAASQWDEVRALARSPELRIVLSNTTESGYDLNPADKPGDAPPRSFPAKLLAVLRERFESGRPGLTIVPCELREHNADTLRALLGQLARDWGLSGAFLDWMGRECVWLNTLVDRIVVDPPADHPLRAEDAMLAVCEPYALWAIQKKTTPFLRHPAVVWTPDVQPYFLRKVRILNGGHTALLIKAWPRGLRTVRQAVEDAELGPWLERLLFEEVVPVLEGRVDDPAAFARQVLDRFRNPFFEHQLASIAAHHAAKVQVRLVPTLEEFQAKFGRTPPLLQEVLTMPQPA